MKIDKKDVADALAEAILRTYQQTSMPPQPPPPEPIQPAPVPPEPQEVPKKPSLLERAADLLSRSLVMNCLRVFIIMAAIIFGVSFLFPHTMFVSAHLNHVEQVSVDSCRMEEAVFAGHGCLSFSDFGTLVLRPGFGKTFVVNGVTYGDDCRLMLYDVSKESKCVIRNSQGKTTYACNAINLRSSNAQSLHTSGKAVLAEGFEHFVFSGEPHEELAILTDAVAELRRGDEVLCTLGAESDVSITAPNCNGMIITADMAKLMLYNYDNVSVLCSEVHRLSTAGEGRLQYTSTGSMQSLSLLGQQFQVTGSPKSLNVELIRQGNDQQLKLSGAVSRALVAGSSIMPTFRGWLLDQQASLAVLIGALIVAGCVLVTKKRSR